MLDWAEKQRVAGRTPDFTLPLNRDHRRAFKAFLHKALRHDILHADPEIARTILEDVEALGHRGKATASRP